MGMWADLLGTVRDTFTVGRGTAATSIRINGVVGTLRSLIFQTTGENRWAVRANTGAEGGGNSGSSFVVAAFDDDGATLDNALVIERPATGNMMVGRYLLIKDGNVAQPGWAFENDADLGFYRVGGNEMGAAANTVEQWRYDNNGFRFSRGVRIVTTTISANTTLDASYVIVLADASAGGFTITLSNATSGGESRHYEIVKIDSTTNAVVIDGNGSQTINGALTFTLSTPGEAITLIGDSASASWKIR